MCWASTRTSLVEEILVRWVDALWLLWELGHKTRSDLPARSEKRCSVAELIWDSTLVASRSANQQNPSSEPWISWIRTQKADHSILPYDCQLNMAQKCVHQSCGKVYTDPEEECHYHSGPPIFHEGQKGKLCMTYHYPLDLWEEILS